jgi:hypothetical protein
VPRISGDKDQIPSIDVIFLAADNRSVPPLEVKSHGFAVGMIHTLLTTQQDLDDKGVKVFL